MKKFNLIFTLLFFIVCFISCTSSSSKNKSSDQDAGLEDIVESPPEKKVNHAPVPTATPNASTEKERITTGTFATLEEGDYYYIHIKDENNQETSFTLWSAYEGAANLNIDNWESVRGKKIKVTWEESMEEIPEAGEKMLIKKVLAIDILD